MSESDPDSPVRAKRTSADVAVALRAEISDQSPAGSRLGSERVLSQRFGVARNTVRRALQQLQREGWIETRKNSGSFVIDRAYPKPMTSFENARPLELMDARFAFEPHICRLAVVNAKPSDLKTLYRLLEEMEDFVANAVRFSEYDADFHVRLVKTTGNPLLVWIASQINLVRSQQGWTRMRELTLGPEIIATYNTQLRAILDAIARREPELAASSMKEHLETARLSLTRASET